MHYIYTKKHTIWCYLCIITFSFLVSTYVSAADETATSPSLKEQKSQEGFIVNLRDLIKKSQKKIEQVDEKIKEQEMRRRNQQREEKAREYYEKAKRLFDEGKFDEARELWDKAIKITEHPEMKDYIRENISKTKRQKVAFSQEEQKRLKRLEAERGYDAKDVEKQYQEAVSLYKQKKYVAAKDAFEAVEEMFPDHKATRSYVMIIDQEIEKEQKDIIEQKLKEEAVAKQKEKDAWRKALEEKEKDRQQALRQKAENLYREAVRLYKEKQPEAAKEKFKEIEWILPNYKETVSYLVKLDKSITPETVLSAQDRERFFAKQLHDERVALESEASQEKAKDERQKQIETARKTDEADFVYAAAVSLYNKRDYQAAQVKFLETEKIVSGYKDTEKYLQKIAKRFGQTPLPAVSAKKIPASAGASKKEVPVTVDPVVQKAIQERDKALMAKAEQKYAAAVTFYKAKNFPEAKRKFIETEAMYAGYKDVQAYLNRIDEDIVRSGQTGVLPSVKEMTRPVQPAKVAKTKTKEKKKEVVPPVKRERVKKEPSREMDTTVEQKTRIAYAQALALYRQQKYEDARVQFTAVEGLRADYKSTRTYLSAIDTRIKEKQARDAREKEKQILARKRADAITQQRWERDEKRAYEEQLVDASRGGALIKDVSVATAEGVARGSSDLVSVPGEKVSAGMLPVVSARAVTREERKKEWQHRVVQSRQRAELRKQQGAINRALARERGEQSAKWCKDARTIYDEAVRMYREERYAGSKVKFLSVEGMCPGYAATRSYLKELQLKMPRDFNAVGELQGNSDGVALVQQQVDFSAGPIDGGEEAELQLLDDSEYSRQERLERKRLSKLARQVEAARVRETVMDARAVREAEKTIDGMKEEYSQDETLQEDMRTERLQRQDAEKVLFENDEKELEKFRDEIKAEYEKQDVEVRKQEVQEEKIENKTRAEQKYQKEEAHKQAIEQEWSQVTELIAQAADLYEKEQKDAYQDKTLEIDCLLKNGKFSGTRVKKAITLLAKDRQRIDALKEKARREKEYIEKKREEEFSRRKKEEEQLRNSDLAELERKIQIEEDRLAREKRIEEARILREQQRADRLVTQKEDAGTTTVHEPSAEAVVAVAEEQPSVVVASAAHVDDETSSVEKQLQAESLQKDTVVAMIQKRQKELRVERKAVQADFEKNLASLYRTAIQAMSDRDYEKALRLFAELDTLRPEYRNIRAYIQKAELLRARQEERARVVEQKKRRTAAQRVVDVTLEMDTPRAMGFATPQPIKRREQLIADALDSLEKKM